MAQYQKITTTTTLTYEAYMQNDTHSEIWTPTFNRHIIKNEIIVDDVSEKEFLEIEKTVQPAPAK